VYLYTRHLNKKSQGAESQQNKTKTKQNKKQDIALVN